MQIPSSSRAKPQSKENKVHNTGVSFPWSGSTDLALVFRPQSHIRRLPGRGRGGDELHLRRRGPPLTGWGGGRRVGTSAESGAGPGPDWAGPLGTGRALGGAGGGGRGLSLAGRGRGRGRFELPLHKIITRALIKLRSSFPPRLQRFGAPVPDWEMVEGPGCTLNGEKIRARVRPGQVVTDVRGSALQSPWSPGLPHAVSGAAECSQVSRSCNLLRAKWNKDPFRFPRSRVARVLFPWIPPFPKFILALREGGVRASAPAQWRTVQG